MSQETELFEIPPFDLNLEIEILNSLWLSMESADYTEVNEILEGIKNIGYFYFNESQIVFKTLKSLSETGKEFDILILENFFKSQKLTKDLNFYDFKPYFEYPTRHHNHKNYLNILEEKYHRRNLLNISTSIKELVYDESRDIATLLDAAEKSISEFQKQRDNKNLLTPMEILDPLLEKILSNNELFLQGKETVDQDRIPTNFKKLDKLFNGGLNPTDLIIIAGRPAMGKTTLMLNIALNIAESGEAVFISSMEMSADQLMKKLIAFKTGIPFGRLISGKFSIMEKDLVLKAYTDLSLLPIIIDDSSVQTTSSIKAKARRVKNLYPDKKVTVIVDYLGIMTPVQPGYNRNDEMSKMSGGLKAVAKDLFVPVIALSQLSRKCEERQNKRPMLSDLRDSGSVEQDADICAMIYRDEYYNPDTTPDKKIAELNILKHRNGDTGMIKFYFEGGVSQFQELET
jgi:replicative DNA helicase